MSYNLVNMAFGSKQEEIMRLTEDADALQQQVEGLQGALTQERVVGALADAVRAALDAPEVQAQVADEAERLASLR